MEEAHLDGQPIGSVDLLSGLAGRRALVTGGLGGIGRACVQVLHAHGARVAFTWADGHEQPQDAQQVVSRDPQRLCALPLDLRRSESIRACVADATARWAGLDILVNNAAVGSATVAAYSQESGHQDSQMLAINADGTLKMCQAFLQAGSAGQGAGLRKIINIASVGGGVQVFPHFRLADGMSKAAVATLTRQLAAELVHADIDVFAVCPGATDTPMFRASTLDPMPTGQRDEFIGRLPRGRLIEPLEVARLVAFLATEHSTLLHGAVLDASMGLGVRPGLITESPH